MRLRTTSDIILTGCPKPMKPDGSSRASKSGSPQYCAPLGSLKLITATTITSAGALNTELKAVRARGYAIDDEE